MYHDFEPTVQAWFSQGVYPCPILLPGLYPPAFEWAHLSHRGEFWGYVEYSQIEWL
jgi:hypothetical protein